MAAGRWLQAPSQVAEAALTLGYFFGAGIPVMARMARASGAERARELAFAHAARARRLAGIDVEVRGEHHLAEPGGRVLVYNQTSLVDDIGAIEVVWRHARHNVMAAEYGRIPFFRRAAEKSGILLLERGDREAADRLLDRLTRVAASGECVAVAPEGRLSPDGEVGHFKRGAFLVAIRAGVRVIPMAVAGGREILAPGGIRLRPGRLVCEIGEPVEPAGLTEADAPELAERVRRRVASLYESARERVRTG